MKSGKTPCIQYSTIIKRTGNQKIYIYDDQLQQHLVQFLAGWYDWRTNWINMYHQGLYIIEIFSWIVYIFISQNIWLLLLYMNFFLSGINCWFCCSVFCKIFRNFMLFRLKKEKIKVKTLSVVVLLLFFWS